MLIIKHLTRFKNNSNHGECQMSDKKYAFIGLALLAGLLKACPPWTKALKLYFTITMLLEIR